MGFHDSIGFAAAALWQMFSFHLSTLAVAGSFFHVGFVRLQIPPDSGRRQAAFITTRWSVVLAAGRRRSANSAEALRWLCEQYWFPIYTYARQRGRSPHEAEDLAQGFFAEMLSENMVAAANADRGSFRTFLLLRFDQFIGDAWKRDNSIKRGGKLEFIALHEVEAENRFQNQFADHSTPEHAFDRAWILSVMARVKAVLREECEAGGKVGRYSVLKDFLEAEGSENSYAEAARSLQITVPALRMLIFRLRERFREMMMREIRQTVVTEAEVRPELAHLLSVL